MTKKLAPGMQSEEAWQATRDGIQNGSTALQFGFSVPSIPGISCVEVKSAISICPYGWVWYRQETGNVLSVAMSFVNPQLRRCGLRTAMHNQLLEWYPETRMVVTGRATEEAKPWLLKMGFKFNKDFDRWELLVEPKPKKK